MLQSNPRMLTSGSHPQAIVSSSTPQYPSAEQPTPQALYGKLWCPLLSPGCVYRYSFGVLSTRSPFFPAAATVHQSYPHHATQLHGHQPQPATTPTGSQPQSQHAAPSPVQVPVMWEWVGRSEWLNQEWVARRGLKKSWVILQQRNGMSLWFACTAGWVTLIPHFYSGSTRRGRPHTWAVDSHSRTCTIQGP